MVPYLLLLLALTLLGIFLCERKKSRRNDAVFLGVASLAMVAMSTLRGYTVGIDNDLYYIPYLQRMREGGWDFLISARNEYRMEPGYSLINFLVTRVTDNPTALFGVLAVLAIGLTALFVWKYSPSVWMSIFVFVSFGFFGYTMVTLRQQLAICIAMFALPWLQRKKLLPYLGLVVLAALFHKSLWILVPVYFIAWLPLNWKTVSLYSGGTLLVLIFTDPILDFITQFVYKIYTDDNYFRAMGRNIQTAFIPVVLFLVVLLMKKRLLQRDPANLPLMNFAAYSCFLFILTLKTFIFQRLALIFLPVAVLLLPRLMEAMTPDPGKLAQLESLKPTGKRQPSQKYLDLKLQLKDETTMYYATIGFILFAGWLYYLFLQTANRLLLVPYFTIF